MSSTLKFPDHREWMRGEPLLFLMFDIRDFGAVEGKDCAAAIQAAFNAAKQAGMAQKPARVFLPSGLWGIHGATGQRVV